MHATDATAKFDGVHAVLNLREVVQFPTVSFIDRMTDGRTACRGDGTASKSRADVQRRNRVVAERFVRVASKLKTRFIDRLGVDYRGFR